MSTGSEDVDRISDLPEPIISVILSFLPTKSAVATSFLAKSWRFRWTGITAFDFGDELWPDRDKSEPETNGDAVPPPRNSVEFVNLVFSYHTGILHKLRIRWESQNNIRSVYLSFWLNSAIARNFRVLDLCTVSESFSRDDPEAFMFDLPDALYTCGTLEALKLRGQIRIKNPYFARLPKLAVLELCFVLFECNDSLEKLVSACPLLESLKMESHYRGLIEIKVSSPSLKHLEIVFLDYYGYHGSKLVIDTPSLEHLVLKITKSVQITCSQVIPVNEVDIDTCRHRCPGVGRLIQACGGAKVMRLDKGASDDLFCSKDIPFPANFGRFLTKLVVKFHFDYWSNMWDLIGRCNNLQVLDITPVPIPKPKSDDCPRLPLHIPGCLSSSLKHVYFRNYCGNEVDTRMIRFLLNHGLHIERLTLSTPFYGLCNMEEHILNEVSMLSRASATCKINVVQVSCTSRKQRSPFLFGDLLISYTSVLR